MNLIKKLNYNLAAVTALLLVLGTGSPLLAAGDSPILITTTALKEVVVVNDKGEKVIERVPVEKALPGDSVIFVNLVTNNSDSTAEKVVVDNPIPENMEFIAGMVSSSNAAVTFSVDGGKKFAGPGLLMVVNKDGTLRKATPADYTNIRWQLLTPLQGKATQQVEFQARVK